jgi:hypothetical protein
MLCLFVNLSACAAFAPNTQLNLQVQTNLIARPDLRYVRANDRNVVSLIALVAATPLPRSQPQRCQPLVTRIVLGFEK